MKKYNWQDIKQGDVVLMLFLPNTRIVLDYEQRDLFLVKIKNINHLNETFSGKSTVNIFYCLDKNNNFIKKIKLDTRNGFYCWEMKDNIILNIFH